jgi:hypothetical protein
MEQNNFLEVNCRPVTPEISPFVLWNPKVHYYVLTKFLKIVDQMWIDYFNRDNFTEKPPLSYLFFPVYTQVLQFSIIYFAHCIQKYFNSLFLHTQKRNLTLSHDIL